MADTASGVEATVLHDYHDTAMRGCVATVTDDGVVHNWVPVQNLRRA